MSKLQDEGKAAAEGLPVAQVLAEDPSQPLTETIIEAMDAVQIKSESRPLLLPSAGAQSLMDESHHRWNSKSAPLPPLEFLAGCHTEKLEIPTAPHAVSVVKLVSHCLWREGGIPSGCAKETLGDFNFCSSMFYFPGKQGLVVGQTVPTIWKC